MVKRPASTRGDEVKPFDETPSGELLASVPLSVWRRPDLSVKAKGLLAVLLTFPPGFLPTVREVERVAGMGRDARRAAYSELRAAGLLQTRFGAWSVNLPKGGAA